MQHVEKERRPNHQNQYCAALRSYCLSCFTPQFNNSILIYAVRWHQIWNMKFSCSYKKNGFPELSDKGCCRNWSETVSWSLISLVLCPRSGVKDCFELLMEKRWSKKRVVCVMCVIRCCPPLSHTHTYTSCGPVSSMGVEVKSFIIEGAGKSTTVILTISPGDCDVPYRMSSLCGQQLLRYLAASPPPQKK